ncbi:unnamed protein product [Vitrella brassicaformis CCMP3155]|uniref:Protein FRA10AC1 n=1 Tax=Vitrella brassicaformis (strain CCMP3155) TaxID=1169540 RepID=A0A0G4EQS5_VITBC|nr:unnamed protein product [Vitrella brassicaformis CCMP3155]|eukprot:CEL99790.1 unnamed protein product [Vitrella brassicaformis CCMP3155]
MKRKNDFTQAHRAPPYDKDFRHPPQSSAASHMPPADKRPSTMTRDRFVAPARKPDFVQSAVKARAYETRQEWMSMDAYQRHQLLMRWVGGGAGGGGQQGSEKRAKTDYDALRENHRFLRTEADDDGSWEARQAKRYYDRLFKEYVICDLTRYKSNQVGFRWRTEAEVVQGVGQFRCGNKHCDKRFNMRTYEVHFRYKEAGAIKEALVKVRLCPRCAYKLNYRHIQAAKKKAKKESRRARRAGKDAKPEGEGQAEPVVVKEEPESPSGGEAEAEDENENEAAGEAEEREPPETEKDMDELTLRELEERAWKGPREEATRTREDEMDDFFRDLIL